MGGALRVGRLGALLATLGTAGFAQPAAAEVFTFTGAEQTYIVPAGANAVEIVAVGGKGRDGFLNVNNGQTPGDGGFGAVVSATVPVTPGQTLYVAVGGNGTGPPGTNIFNGGGDQSGFVGGAGGAGGGASDVRTCSRLATCPPLGSLADPRLLVAGGGGGGGGSSSGSGGDGGDAGSTPAAGTGGDGTSPASSPGPGLGGLPGTGSAGGTGGAAGSGSSSNNAQPGVDGSAGQGGRGGPNPASGGGGGGGGGYFGGGGGGGGGFDSGTRAGGGGGGAGSSFVVTGATGVAVATDTTGTPSVSIVPVSSPPSEPPSQPPSQPPSSPPPSSPTPSCASASADAVPFRPGQPGDRGGPRLLGVRTQVSVDQPARIEITAALRYREGGVGRQVDLGTYAQDNPGQSTLRLALPERLQNRLDVGRRVRVLLDVTTTPTSKPGCATATTEQIKFRSRLVRLRRTTAPVGTR